MGIKVTGQEAPDIEPGHYQGRCEYVTLEEGNHGPYLDVGFAIETEDGVLTRNTFFGLSKDQDTGALGFTPKSDLGKLLSRCGVDVGAVVAGEESLDVEEFLTGQEFEFSLIKDPENDFTNVSKDTIQPLGQPGIQERLDTEED